MFPTENEKIETFFHSTHSDLRLTVTKDGSQRFVYYNLGIRSHFRNSLVSLIQNMTPNVNVEIKAELAPTLGFQKKFCTAESRQQSHLFKACSVASCLVLNTNYLNS
jgi:hypothetical protein